MPDQPVTEERPLVFRDELHKLLFYFLRVFCRASGPIAATGAPHGCPPPSRVHTESIPQNNIGCFATHAAQGLAFFHRARDLASMPLHNCLGGGLDAFGLVPKKTCRLIACSSSAAGAAV